ncbi:FABP family protein [Frankia sp. CNm7]|uniref:Peroxynitrite isomerase n=1 Tax=Frankia nepalensis TaxID=1836974 RepID=A0A937UK06_9ACTN|nr:FABP family protein [Frankia nepalensis]MBL7497688.1 FABP family protein [Frankia nepalensis]MBL7516023.1 FABP family protein [Frankia nepalensis]MBL7520921.1 FABP family protein [Frankia nepalensis]MBL7626324.1 FABP family protein [Frankia nepalensis]
MSVPDLPPSLEPLAFLVGTWRGEGVGGYTDLPDFRYEQEITFLATGRPALAYASTTWWADEPRDGREPGSPLATETGFWRLQDDPARPGGKLVEVMLAHPFGIAEIYVGTLTGTKIELDSNVLIRTATAREVTRSVRLYGVIEGGDLAYAIDMEAEGKPMQPHLSARLRKVAD